MSKTSSLFEFMHGMRLRANNILFGEIYRFFENIGETKIKDSDRRLEVAHQKNASLIGSQVSFHMMWWPTSYIDQCLSHVGSGKISRDVLSCYRVRASHKHVLRAHYVYPWEHATDGGKSCSAIKPRVRCKVTMVHKALRGVLTDSNNMGTLGSS